MQYVQLLWTYYYDIHMYLITHPSNGRMDPSVSSFM